MKKIIIAIAAVFGLGSFYSCSDMLETDSSRYLFDPEMNEKTDSMYYAFGVLQALQGVIDQYYMQGELRGDLVDVIPGVTDKNLQELANFSATATNKYDSAYQYYRVINNCNYYIAHRDTSLLTGSTEVVKNEYVSIKAIRAWAYLQLVRNYGEVPFVTEPLTSISQIESTDFGKKDLQGIVNELAPDLEQYTGTPCPNHGDFDFGTANWGGRFSFNSSLLYMPVDLVLGDLYLESGNYSGAASHYVTYLTQVANASQRTMIYRGTLYSKKLTFSEMPSDYASNAEISGLSYSSTIRNTDYENISLVQMPMNSQMGITTSLAEIYGIDFYSSSSNINSMYLKYPIQLKISKQYQELKDTLSYYYYETGKTNIKSAKVGDTRYDNIIKTDYVTEDSIMTWIEKTYRARVPLYSTATVWLRLAEALNRLGYPDLAFAILKEGLNPTVLTYANYIRPESREVLTDTYPLLSSANVEKFTRENSMGVHQRGCGFTSDYGWSTADYRIRTYSPGISPYQMDVIVGNKLAYIAERFGVQTGETLVDEINAVEDLICDEYALETAFEGTRYYDLMRLARHKNRLSPAGYPANFGGIWLKEMLKAKTTKDLSVEKNWYLPFN